MTRWSWCPLALLVACSSTDGDTDGAPTPTADEGPFVGTALHFAEDGLWLSAPGAVGDGSVVRFEQVSGEVGLSDATLTVSADGPMGLGGSFARCGSWNGTPAVAIGAPDDGDAGRTWIVTAPGATVTLGDQAVAEGRVEGGHSGSALACGDLDGDGRDELAISAPDTEGVVTDSGTVDLFHDDAGLVDKIANVDTTWTGARLGFRTGLSAGIDLDGDGFGDLVAGGSGSDRVHVLAGPITGTVITNSYGVTLQGQPGDGTGYAIATGDLDGDGITDLVLGAPLADQGRGGVWIVSGPFDASAAGLLRDGAEFVPGVSAGGQAGFSVAVPGDVDGDGRDDLLIGAPFAGGVGDEAGAAYLLLAAHLDVVNLDLADTILLGDVAGGRLGFAVAGGDVDGDGQIELVVAAPTADVDDAIGAGQVFAFDAALRGVHYPGDAEARIHR